MNFKSLSISYLLVSLFLVGCNSQSAGKIENQPSIKGRVCAKPDGKHHGIPASEQCEPPTKEVLKRPDTGFLGLNAASAINFDTAQAQAYTKTFDQLKKAAAEARQKALERQATIDKEDDEFYQRFGNDQLKEGEYDKWRLSRGLRTEAQSDAYFEILYNRESSRRDRAKEEAEKREAERVSRMPPDQRAAFELSRQVYKDTWKEREMEAAERGKLKEFYKENPRPTY